MDTIQNIIFAVAGIIYLVYSALKKARPNQPTTGQPTPQPKDDDIPSLEDLLREITQTGRKGKQEVEKKVKPAQPIPAPVKPITTNTPEPFSTAKNHTFERRPAYERLEQDSPSYETGPSADDLAPLTERTPIYVNEAATVDYEDPKFANYAGLDKLESRFQPFEKEQKRVNLYAQLLRDPQTARQAFVFSEIFKRKYE